MNHDSDVLDAGVRFAARRSRSSYLAVHQWTKEKSKADAFEKKFASVLDDCPTVSAKEAR